MACFHNIAELCGLAVSSGERISGVALKNEARELSLPPEQVFLMMKNNLCVMREAANAGISSPTRSESGLSGGDAHLMDSVYKGGGSLCGGAFTLGLIKALAVAEHNAQMGRIVAAPTAGSCGVLPGAILSVLESRGLSDDEGVYALFTAGAVGMVISTNATVSGAEGGCQAECGTASAMAAAALVELMGGSPEMAANAVAIALKNMLGLVCDPVAGLVEVPCIKRNAAGVSGAFTAAEMALAGVKSAIPADEVILAMLRVGRSLPPSLRETAEGGLAVTPTGCAHRQRIFGS